MRPFSTTVFRIRLLLLAGALGLMGLGADKKAPRIADSATPTKAAKASTHQPQPTGKMLAVQRQEVSAGAVPRDPPEAAL
jgi:hypothetical protein